MDGELQDASKKWETVVYDGWRHTRLEPNTSGGQEDRSKRVAWSELSFKETLGYSAII